jgi:hypothetical protein
VNAQCPAFEWCDDTDPAHLPEKVHSTLFEAVAEESKVPVTVSHDSDPGADGWHVSIELGPWDIDSKSTAAFAAELDREFANLRSIVDQVESRVREFHRLYVGSTVRRQVGVDEHLLRLADA